MPLQKILVDIPLGQGINQSTDPMLLPPGELTEAVNVRYDKLGRTSKRYGFVQSASTTSCGLINNGETVFSFPCGDSILGSVRPASDAYADEFSLAGSGNAVDADAGFNASALISSIGNALSVTTPYYVVFSDIGSSANVAISGGNSGGLSENSFQAIRVVSSGQRALLGLVYLNVGGSPTPASRYGVVSVNNGSSVSNTEVSFESGGSAIGKLNSRYWFCDFAANQYTNASGTVFFDTYSAGVNTGTTTISIGANGGDVRRSFNAASTPSAIAININRTNRDVVLAWVDSQGVKCSLFAYGVTAAYSSATVSTQITSGTLSTYHANPMSVGIVGDSIAIASSVISNTTTNPQSYVALFTNSNSTVVSGFSVAYGFHGLSVHSKIFTRLPNRETTNSTGFIALFDADSRAVGVYSLGFKKYASFLVGEAASVSDGLCTATYGFDAGNYTVTGLQFQASDVAGLGLLKKTFTDDLSSPPINQTFTDTFVAMHGSFDGLSRGFFGVQSKAGYLSGGGVMCEPSDINMSRVGFDRLPVVVSTSNTTSTPSAPFVVFSGEGSYQLYCTCETYGKSGAAYVSAPSVPVSVSIGSVTTYVQVVARIASVGFERYPDQSKLVLYSTDANETEPYRVAWSPVGNFSLSVGFSGEVISGSDDLRTSEILYTVGEPENYWPGAVSAIAADSNRVYVVPGHNRYVVLPSKPLEGNRACAFYPGVERAVPARGGPCTALARLDGKLFAFKQTSVFVAQGDGPDATGANDNLSEFDALPDRCGAYNQRSVLVTPFGVVCVGPAGIYLIDRALQSVHIGEKVQDDIIGQKFSISSMVYRPDTEDMLIIFDNYGDKTTSSYSLQYNFKAQAWSHVQNMIGIGAAVSDTAFVSSANITDTVSNEGSLNFYFAPSPGATAAYTAGVFQESYGAYTDNQAITANRTYYQTFETGWIKTDSLQRANRVYRAILSGSANTSVTFNAQVKVAFDFESSWNETHTISVNAATTGSTPFEFEVPFQRQKCKSFKLQVSETGASEGLAGYTLTGLSVEIGVKQSALGLRSEKKSP